MSVHSDRNSNPHTHRNIMSYILIIHNINSVHIPVTEWKHTEVPGI